MDEYVPLEDCSGEISQFVLDNTIINASFPFSEVVNKILGSGLNIPVLTYNNQIYCWCNYNKRWYLVASQRDDLNIIWKPRVSVDNGICTINYLPEAFIRETFEMEKPSRFYKGEEGKLGDILCQIFVGSKTYQAVFPKPVVKSRVSDSTKRYEGDIQLVTKEYFEKRYSAIIKMAEIGEPFGLTVNE